MSCRHVVKSVVLLEVEYRLRTGGRGRRSPLLSVFSFDLYNVCTSATETDGRAGGLCAPYVCTFLYFMWNVDCGAVELILSLTAG